MVDPVRPSRAEDPISGDAAGKFSAPSRQDLLDLRRAIEKLTDGVTELSSKMTRPSSPIQVDGSVSVGNLTLDSKTHLVTIEDSKIELSAGEFRLLQRLAVGYPEVVGLGDLDLAYHGHTVQTDRNLRVYVRRLRQKLDLSPVEWNCRIANVRSVGYRIIGPADLV